MNKLLKLINGLKFSIRTFWEIVDEITKGFYDELHKGMWIRRIILFISVAVQVYALFWSFGFAMLGGDLLGKAAIIGAIMTPVSALLGVAIKLYNDGRKNNKEEK